MAVTANRSSIIIFTGDVTGTETLTAALNAASPGAIEIKTLAAGANTITVPTGEYHSNLSYCSSSDW